MMGLRGTSFLLSYSLGEGREVGTPHCLRFQDPGFSFPFQFSAKPIPSFLQAKEAILEMDSYCKFPLFSKNNNCPSSLFLETLLLLTVSSAGQDSRHVRISQHRSKNVLCLMGLGSIIWLQEDYTTQKSTISGM